MCGVEVSASLLLLRTTSPAVLRPRFSDASLVPCYACLLTITVLLVALLSDAAVAAT